MRETHYTGTGQRMMVHPVEECCGPCVIHRPSQHHMKDWPTHWRGDRMLMERLCPHGVGHPDPDHLAGLDYISGLPPGAASEHSIHGCDGCCRVSGGVCDSEK